jgi:hypothetical protein
VALIVGLTIPGALLPALVVLAALSLVTLIQRLVTAWRGLPRTEARAGPDYSDEK